MIRTHSAPCSIRSQLLGISQGLESPGSLGSLICLDLNPSSAQTSSGSQLVNIYVASIPQALGSGNIAVNKTDSVPAPTEPTLQGDPLNSQLYNINTRN